MENLGNLEFILRYWGTLRFLTRRGYLRFVILEKLLWQWNLNLKCDANGETVYVTVTQMQV